MAVPNVPIHQRIRFGFEYETLVEVSPLFTIVLTDLFTHRTYANITDYPLRELPDDPDSKNIIGQFLMAYSINSYIDRFNDTEFRVGVEYHEQTYPTFTSLITRQVREPEPTKIWTITYDMSVMMRSDPPSHVKPYTNLLTYGKEPIPAGDVILENVEIVSPILTWDDVHSKVFNNNTTTYFEKIMDNGLRINNTFRYWNNSTTSNHVHVSCGDDFKNPYNLLKAANAWLFFEPVFLLLVAPWRRGNPYCKSMYRKLRELHDVASILTRLSDSVDSADFFSRFETDNQAVIVQLLIQEYQKNTAENPTVPVDRYVACNLANILTKGTIEIRLKHGSNDSKENSMYMSLLGAFFSAVLQQNIIGQLYDRGSLELSIQLSDELYANHVTNNHAIINMCNTLFRDFMQLDPSNPLFTYWSAYFTGMRLFDTSFFNQRTSGGRSGGRSGRKKQKTIRRPKKI